MRSQSIGGDRKDFRVGLIGCGIKGSRTPAMHIAQAQAQGLRCEYNLLDTDDTEFASLSFAEILDRCAAAGYAGVNVTYPYKVEALDHVDELDSSASAVGAVNTIVFDGQRRVGHNTDTVGFAEGFRQDFAQVPYEEVLLIGAGGAGGAVARALADCGVKTLRIFDLDHERAQSLAAQIGQMPQPTQCLAIKNLADDLEFNGLCGIVNATPVGMEKLPGSPFPVDLLDPSIWVVDIVYFPMVTELLRAARAAGCKTMGGESMAVYQAARAYQLFTNQVADPKQMRAAFEACGDYSPNKEAI